MQLLTPKRTIVEIEDWHNHDMTQQKNLSSNEKTQETRNHNGLGGLSH